MRKHILVALMLVSASVSAAPTVPKIKGWQGQVTVIASYTLGSSTFYRVLLDDTECLVQQVPNGSLSPDWVIQSCNWGVPRAR